MIYKSLAACMMINTKLQASKEGVPSMISTNTRGVLGEALDLAPKQIHGVHEFIKRGNSWYSPRVTKMEGRA